MKSLILLILPWHLLTWSDFKGEPYGGFTAVSSIDMVFESHGNSDYDILDSITVQFHTEASFSISKDPYVLNHEQGHLSLCYLICRQVNRMCRKQHTKYTHGQFDAMCKEVTRRWHSQDDLYDKETDHSINHEAQTRWDSFIKKELAK